MNLPGISAARRGRKVEVEAITGGSWGGYGPGRLTWGYQDGLDYNREAGLRYDNSIVYAIISFLVTCINSVPIIVAKEDKSGKLVPIPNHPIAQLLTTPAPWYPGTLMSACQVTLECARGNSYVYKHRNPNTGYLVALEFMPEGTCIPYTYPGSGQWISEYRLTTPSGMWRVPPCDVLHMRWETPYPSWPQLGMSPLEACLPDLVADKQAAMHEASIIRNSGVSPISVSPKPPPGFTGSHFLLSEDQRKQLKDDIEDNISGGNKGRPLAWSYPMDITKIAFDPKELDLRSVRDLSEQRLCSGFNVHPAVMGLGTGLREANNRASIQGAIDITIEMGVVPYMKHRGAQFTFDLIPEMGQPGEVVMYDLSKLEPLKDKLMRQAIVASGGPPYTVNEVRGELLGMPPVDGGDVLRQPGALGKPESDGDGSSGPSASDSTMTDVDNGRGKREAGRGGRVQTDDGGDD